MEFQDVVRKRKMVRSFEDRLTFTYLTALPMDELLTGLSKL